MQRGRKKAEDKKKGKKEMKNLASHSRQRIKAALSRGEEKGEVLIRP